MVTQLVLSHAEFVPLITILRSRANNPDRSGGKLFSTVSVHSGSVVLVVLEIAVVVVVAIPAVVVDVVGLTVVVVVVGRTLVVVVVGGTVVVVVVGVSPHTAAG